MNIQTFYMITDRSDMCCAENCINKDKKYPDLDYLFSNANALLCTLTPESGIYLMEVSLPLGYPNLQVLDISDRIRCNELSYRSNMIVISKCHDLSDVSTFKMLVNNGGKIEHNLENILTWAASNGFCHIIEYVLSHMKRLYQSNPHFNGSCQFTPNCLCLDKNRLASINNPEICVNTNISSKIMKVFCIAAAKGHFEIVDFLIKNGIKKCENATNSYVLPFSVDSGNLQLVQLLIENGFVDRLNYALIRCAMFGHLHIMKYLVDTGANVNYIDGNETALVCAANNGFIDIVKYLLTKNVDVGALNDLALQWAAKKDHQYIVGLLRPQHPNVNVHILSTRCKL